MSILKRNCHKRLESDLEIVNIYLCQSGAKDSILTYDVLYKVCDKVNRHCTEDQKEFSTCKHEKGNAQFIHEVSQKNFNHANDYFLEIYAHYQILGYKEVPTLSDRLSKNIENIKKKIFTHSHDNKIDNHPK